MSRDTDHLLDESPGATLHALEAVRVFDRYLADIEAGRAVDPERLISEHLSIADELRAFLNVTQVVDHVAGRSVPEFADFRIVSEIGRGGMGVVYDAEQVSLGRRVALKILPYAAAVDPRLLRRFQIETQAAAQLHHPHIVPVFAVGCERGLNFYAMRYIDGPSLATVIGVLRRRRDNSGVIAPSDVSDRVFDLASDLFSGRFVSACDEAGATNTREKSGGRPKADSPSGPSPVPAAATRARPSPGRAFFRSVAYLGIQAAEALGHAHHMGVVHRDIKPGNLLLDASGNLWVTDFGLARMSEHSDLTPGGDILGTLRFMSPEQALAKRITVDERTDVYSLGVTLYELLTLEPAFQGNDRQEVLRQIAFEEPRAPRRIEPSIPGDLETIVLKAMSKEPDARYATAVDMAADLRRFLMHQPIQARRPTLLERAEKRARRHRGLVVAGLVLLVLAAGISTTVAALIAQEQRKTAAAARASRIESLAQKILRTRLTAHEAGWSDRVRSLIGEAVDLGVDENLKGQAAASLAGLDARSTKRFPGLGGYSLAFDRTGEKLLIASTIPEDSRKANGAKLWDSRAGRLDDLSEVGEGPVAFRPDGTPMQLVISLENGGEQALALRELDGTRKVTRFVVPGRLDRSHPWQVALSPDLSLAVAPIVSPEGSPALAVWDASTGKLVRRFDGPSSAVAFATDGSLLARGDADGRITVWALPQGEQIASLRADRNTINSLAFARDRRRYDEGEAHGKGRGWLLASGDSGAAVTVWDLGTATPRVFCRGSHHEVTAVAFSPDGQTLASAGRSVQLWDLATGRSLLRIQSSDFIHGLAFSPDGRRLAAAALGFFSGPLVEVWAVEPHRGVQALRGLLGQVSKFTLSPDGKLAAALSQDWRVAVWEIGGGSLLHVFDAPRGASSDNAALAFDPKGRRLAFATSGRAVLWDLDTGLTLRSWALPPSLLDTLAFHESGKLLIGRLETKDHRPGPFGDVDWHDHPRVYRVRDLQSPDGVERPLCELGDFRADAFDSLATPGGRFFVVDGIGGPDGRRRVVKAFDPLSGRTLFESTPDVVPPCSCIKIDPTGRVLYVAEGNLDRVVLLEIPTGRTIRTLDESDLITLGPDGRRWAVTRKEVGQVPGFSIREPGGRRLVDLGIDARTSGGVAFDIEDRTFAWGSSDGTLFLADLHKVQQRLAAVGLGW